MKAVVFALETLVRMALLAALVGLAVQGRQTERRAFKARVAARRPL